MNKNTRISLVDALRGFALLGIVLIHSIEHFDFFRLPDSHFIFSRNFDAMVMEWGFLLVGGKAYSIFAFMFGLSFFIQMDRQQKKGIDFSGRFAWRLMILSIFGFIHSLFYEGDILLIYAALGLPLLFLNKLNSKVLLVLAILLALQVPIIYTTLYSFMNPGFEYQETFGAGLWGVGAKVYAEGNLMEVIQYNFWKGRSAVWGWTYYNGRYLQLIALFIAGLLIGRNQFFEKYGLYKKQILNVFIYSVIGTVVIYTAKLWFRSLDLTASQSQLLEKLAKSYSDLTNTAAIISLFILLYIVIKKNVIFSTLASYGRMSLTNYVSQSLFGVFFFYNFGLGMYHYLGSTWSLFYGIMIFLIQATISNYWIKKYYYGPLEWFWRALTYFNFKLKFKR